MVDQEVVDILAEIKHRITAAQPPTAAKNGGNVSEASNTHQPVETSNHYPSLVVLARTWDRLPPVVSNRTGTAASLELWIKNKLRRALRWITWEQVNFNAATHQTFRELIDSVNSSDQRLAVLEHQLPTTLAAISDELRSELRDNNNALRRELTSLREQLERSRAEIARHQAEANSQLALLSEERKQFEAAINSLIAEHRALLNARIESQVATTSEKASTEIQERVAALVKEFRERDERLLDEQRVCFKQLTLELTESQVLQDRARRELDARVGKLESSNKS